MTRIAQAVIGAGYGDEGKGATVDALAAVAPGVVVRSNGGAQAGHTVVLPTGERHVFHHIGAGALAGAATQLSRFFVVHPMFFLEERERVAELGGCVDVGIDPRALVTTPYDILINQALEMHRGNARHGSCGFGFGETIERAIRPQFALSMQHLVRNDLRAKLDAVRRQWLPERFAALGMDIGPHLDLVLDDRVLDRFLSDCQDLLDRVRLRPDAKALASGPIVFEGAQGLMLDQDYGAFPHVTRSNTGLLNMAAIAAEAGIDAIRPHYATRSYATRHGAGPLDNEVDALDGFVVHDPTNEPNPWQGTIRHAELSADVLAAAVRHDLETVRGSGVAIDPCLVMTCIDQAPTFVPAHAMGRRHSLGKDALPHLVARAIGIPLAGCGRGPGRSDQLSEAAALAA